MAQGRAWYDGYDHRVSSHCRVVDRRSPVAGGDLHDLTLLVLVTTLAAATRCQLKYRDEGRDQNRRTCPNCTVQGRAW